MARTIGERSAAEQRAFGTVSQGRSLLLAIAGLFVVTGCSAKHAAKVLIPANCMHVTIKDFTKECSAQANGDLMCDKVRVHPSCVTVSK